MTPSRPPPPLALIGPTASGKSIVALAIARALDAEIVCVDSMTIYRGMDIGTAKPAPEARKAVVHHLLDIRDPGERFSVAEYQQAARRAIEEIRRRGRRPLLVGGSGLYLRAVIDNLAFPPTDPQVRRHLDGEALETLAARLRQEDPQAAARIDPRNRRRVVRALEVIALTGRPFSAFRVAWERYDGAVTAAGLAVPADVLGERIERRVRAMLDGGLIEEVRRLAGAGLREALTAGEAIGYPQALAHLDGAITREEMFEEIVRATRRFARRQLTWFRRDPRVRWFDGADIGRAAREIRAYYEEELERHGERRAAGDAVRT